MKKNIARVFLVIGLILIVASLIFKFNSKTEEYKSKKEFKERIKKFEENKEGEEEIKLSNSQLALIDIPSLKISSVISDGVEDEVIKYYVGHFKETAYPGQNGNFCVAGHSSNIYSEVFNNLEDINLGDSIEIRTISQKYIYKVSDKFKVSPKDVQVLEQDISKKEMTIVTCTKDGAERFIVKANLQE